MRIAGIDEAGKGPVIGPMVVCGVCCDEEDVKKLEDLGVKDSKKLSPERRKELAGEIRKICEVYVIKIQPEEIDKSENINDILRQSYTEIIEKLNPDLAIVDSPDVKPERIAEFLKNKTGKDVIATHKADEKYAIVSSASIIAKVERDEEIEKLKQIYGDFGSGYASDRRTIEFLRNYILEHGKAPPIARKKWRTIKRLSQHSLAEYLEL
jgi:ribonuclease HII